MCWVFIDQAAAGVSIRVTQRELDQELLQAQPGEFLGWVNLPCLRCWRDGVGMRAWVGRRAELREKEVGLWDRSCALAQPGQDQCESILIDDAACDGGDGVWAGNRTLISAMPAANWAHFSPWAAQPCPEPWWHLHQLSLCSDDLHTSLPHPSAQTGPPYMYHIGPCSRIQLHRSPNLACLSGEGPS